MNPIIPEAGQFGKSRSFEQRKRLIRNFQEEVRKGQFQGDVARLTASSWSFDRIVGYILAEQPEAQTGLRDRILKIEEEAERLASRSEDSLMPLYYAQRSLIVFLDRRPTLRGQLSEYGTVFQTVQRLLDSRTDLDRGGQVRNQLRLLLAGSAPGVAGNTSIALPATFQQAAIQEFAELVPRKWWRLFLLFVGVGTLLLIIWSSLPPATKDRIFGNPATNTRIP